MRFYELSDDNGEIIACEASLNLVLEVADGYLGSSTDHVITMVATDIKVTVDNVRRLLGRIGGYADKVTHYNVRRNSNGRVIAVKVGG